uniref:phage terminase large subunit family protein n=1 Tax=Rhodococcus qingshengii TaxID=334542 RepID=UPI001C4E0881|nr:terminase family protein [Rhodococcus qingshengii]
MTPTVDLDIQQLIDDPAYFAEHAIGVPLWDYQADFARSPARYRVMCAGRQVGKSRVLAVVALHTAYIRANVRVLVISNGEDSSLRVLADCAHLARNSPILHAAVLDDKKQLLTLGNGSTIQSIPASEARARGDSIDLLIVDEAGFISMSLWQAAEPAIVARPGSRVILASTPWGKNDHFFRQKYNEGMTSPSAKLKSWHWPTTASPLADLELIEDWRKSWSTIKFTTEVLAEWVNEAGAYFTMEELDNAVADYDLIDPKDARGQLITAGLDWGFSDAHAFVALAVLDDQDLNQSVVGDDLIYFIPWLESWHKKPYSWFVNRIEEIGRTYQLMSVVSETNGVGAMPTEVLRNTLYRTRQSKRRDKRALPTRVIPVNTDNRYKASGFGGIKLLLQQGRLILPNHPDLLRQLHNLEYEQTDSGQLRIHVREAAGHDDIAMALCQAISTADGTVFGYRPDNPRANHRDLLTTGTGIRIPKHPRCLNLEFPLSRSRGKNTGDGW